MPVTNSQLIKMLQDHIDKYGDNKVMIYDGYDACYKTFSPRETSVNSKKFVIECVNENE